MLNHIVVMGRLTRNPELRKTASGVSVTSFSVAVDRDFSQDGQKETDFLDVVAWRNTAEFAAKYFTKGVWQSCPVACRSGTGRIKTATSAARQKFLPKTSILATAKRRTTALLHPHPHKASVCLRSRAALRPALAAHSPAALCRTLVEDIKRTSCLCRCFDCINFGMLVK